MNWKKFYAGKDTDCVEFWGGKNFQQRYTWQIMQNRNS